MDIFGDPYQGALGFVISGLVVFKCQAGSFGGHAVENRSQCERTYLKSTSESLSHPETSYGKAAGGNCVVARRGGEQPEADLRSQTQVN